MRQQLFNFTFQKLSSELCETIPIFVYYVYIILSHISDNYTYMYTIILPFMCNFLILLMEQNRTTFTIYSAPPTNHQHIFEQCKHML